MKDNASLWSVRVNTVIRGKPPRSRVKQKQREKINALFHGRALLIFGVNHPICIVTEIQ